MLTLGGVGLCLIGVSTSQEGLAPFLGVLERVSGALSFLGFFFLGFWTGLVGLLGLLSNKAA